ncbi:hypothetical protein ACFPES_03890 [Paenibacillus sp. GCM10023248]|uniref:hypothetical protein n=1 Tax=unclassified Paenibacillus TaxID=185978 RepID=UPI00237A088B|nr:hypothetical protein [Paenibacillus sp. MAHUQ-63]MDD9266169.1 hypothetical protein [Paenibacillus sp. MAHUQ-63]
MNIRIRTSLVILIFILALSSIITSCSTNDKIVIGRDIENYPYIPRGNGFSFGFVSDDLNRTVEERIFNIKHNEDLELNIMIANGKELAMDLMVLPIIDFAPREVIINNKKQDRIMFNLEAQKASIVPVKLSNLEKGRHDIIFLIIKDPNNHDINEEYRKSTELNHVVGLRLSVIVDEEKIPEHQIVEGTTLENKVLQGIFLSKKDELTRWLIEDLEGTNNIQYKIQVGNTSESELPYAIIALKDWVPIKFDGKYAIFGSVSPNKRNIYTENLDVQNVTKVSNFTTILIPKPFQLYNRLNSMDIEPSLRLALVK